MKPQPEKYERGFTLMEILVVLAIFAIIMTTIFGSFHSVFSTVEPLEQDLELYQMAQDCLDRMALDLRSVHVSLSPGYRPPDMNDPPDPYRIVGEAVSIESASFARLRFAGLAHVPLGKTRQEGIAEIIYYVQRSSDNHFILRRSDQLYPYKPFSESGTDPILCEFVRGLSFTYFDQEGNDYDRWDSDSEDLGHATPRAVGIVLEVGGSGRPIALETRVLLPVYRKKTGQGK